MHFIERLKPIVAWHRQFYKSIPLRKYSNKIVLGIETSCDDTGCAIMDEKGAILGESIHCQTLLHVEMGGINPAIAREMHAENIDGVVSEALRNASMNMKDIDAVAVTTKPGLKASLYVGTNYGKKLCTDYNKPFIPIHHMQAHALTARIDNEVHFPFLVLLISGGHCLLSVAQSPVKFLLLGYSINDSPGEAFDKVARRLKLRLIPELRNCCGGEAIEIAASKGNPELINLTVPLLNYRDCNFSFSGLKQAAFLHITRQEKEHDIVGGTIPDVYDLSASMLHTTTKHICHRVQRAMVFAKEKELIPPNKQTLVVSGGVACNNYIRRALDVISEEMGYKCVVPPPKLCTDNGIMIAWNGVEKLKLNHDVVSPNDLDSIDVEPKSSIGEDISQAVTDAKIKCKQIKLDQLYKNKSSENSSNTIACTT